MWRLQQNVQYTRRRFFRDIVFFVIVCHLLIFLSFLFLYDKTEQKHHFTISKQSMSPVVVLMPLAKRVPQHVNKSQDKVKQTAVKKVVSYKDYQKKVALKKKKAVAKKVAPVKKVVKKKPAVKPATTLKSVKKESPVKKSPAEKKQKAVSQTVSKKSSATTLKKEKVVEKKVEQKVQPVAKETVKEVIEKKETPVQSDIKQEETTPVEKKVEESKVEPPALQQETVKEVETPVEPAAVQPEPVVETMKPAEDEIDLDNVSFVGRQDLEDFQIQEMLKVEVEKYWKPPVGMSKEMVCELCVKLDKRGNVKKIDFVKRSGSMANDMCARAALLKVQYPKLVWGKEITLKLGQ